MNNHKYDESNKDVKPTGEDSVDVIARRSELSPDDLFSDEFWNKKYEELAKMKVTPVTQYNMEQILVEIEKLYGYVGSIAKEFHDYKQAHISITDCEGGWDKT